MPAGELAKNTLNDGRLNRVDLAQAALGLPIATNRAAHDAEAVAEPAATAALPHAALKAAPGLIGEVPEVECAHRPLEADVKLADLALGQRHDPQRRKPGQLEEARDVLLVPLSRSRLSVSTMSTSPCAAPPAAPGSRGAALWRQRPRGR